MNEMKWHVYIVECSDGSLYTGVAVDIDARIAQHNSGAGAKYTRSRLPVTMVYTETATDKSAALQREYAIKRLKRSDKMLLIGGYRDIETGVTKCTKKASNS